MFTIITGVIIALLVVGFLWFQAFSKNQEANSEAKWNQRNTAIPFVPIPFKPPYLSSFVSFIAIILLFVAISSFTIITAGHQGVQVLLGKVNPNTLPEGAYFVNPISTIYDVDVRVKKVVLTGAQAGTKDLQIVHTGIVVNYRLAADKVAYIFKETGLEVENKILLPAVNESFKAVTARYNSEELITKRNEVSDEIHKLLQTKVGSYGLLVSEISLVNFSFSKDYQAAIEDKVIATQKKLKADQDLERIIVEAQQEIEKAKGVAETIRIQANAIQAQGGKDYVELKKVEKWNGVLPQYQLGSATTLLNIKD